MNVRVRPALPCDLPELVRCIREHAAFERAPPPEVTEATLGEALAGNHAAPAQLSAWVAVRDCVRIVGYFTATRDFSTWRCAPFLHMDCLHVDAAHRRRGVGAALFEALCGFAMDAGIDEIQWQTPEWNQDAASFYRRLGATVLPKLRFVHRLPRQNVVQAHLSPVQPRNGATHR